MTVGINKNDLLPLRDALLEIHSELLAMEKQKYESIHGRVENPWTYFGLVMENPAFQWLRELSSLIVSIDELLAKDEVEQTQITDLVGYVKSAVTPNESGNDFSQKYHKAVQNSPSVAVSHGKLALLFNGLKT